MEKAETFNNNQGFPLVSAQWLSSNLDASNLIILDASQEKNQAKAKTQFGNIQIKGARFFDLKNDFCKTDSPFPNTFPSTEQFESGCRKLGINKTSKIVVYDNIGAYLSPRVWWMFKTMGHDNVYVLDGGLPAWMKAGFSSEEKQACKCSLGDFKANFNAQAVKDFDFVSANVNTQKHLLIDARSPARFKGEIQELRAGLRSGKIPNSINIPHALIFKDGKFKTPSELEAVFAHLKDEKRPLIFSCGSGITACIILLASGMVLDNESAVYDGSWTEWGSLDKG